LADLLEGGVPLPDALERVGRLLPRHALSTVRVGSESGALAPALRQAVETFDLNEPLWLSLIGKIAYVLLVPTIGTAILIFIMLKIVPAYQKIFADFGTDLPPMKQTLISVANAYANYWYLFPFPLLGLLLLVYTMMRYWGWVEWDLPGVARLVRRFDAARVLDSLSLVARQQRPLPEGIATLAASYPKLDVRRRLRQTEADIRAGRDWCESLRRHGLLRPADLAVLQAAQRVGNLPWALQETADSNRRRLAYRVFVILQAAFPLVVIIVGLMVAFVVISLFLPLVTLIQRLAV
jgi:type II secretory pathway component PulF